MMERLNVDDNTPIEASILSNTIENAQKKVESRNFAIRKNVLQYDDVMNRQREIIYEQRDRVLNGDNVKPQIWSMIEQAIESNVARFLPANTPHDDWDLRGLRDHYLGWMITPEELHYDAQALEDLDPADVIAFLKARAQKLYEPVSYTHLDVYKSQAVHGVDAVHRDAAEEVARPAVRHKACLLYTSRGSSPSAPRGRRALR